MFCVIMYVDMPFDSRKNEDIYLENLGIMKAIIDYLEYKCISIVRDWNSDISSNVSLFGNY